MSVCDCELGVIQQYNIYSKTAIFFEKSSGFMYLGLAAAPAAWYNTKYYSWKGANTMSEQPKKLPCGIGLLAHVSAGNAA